MAMPVTRHFIYMWIILSLYPKRIIIFFFFPLRSIFEDRVEMWFVNDIFVDFFTVRLKGIKVINYPQIKIWIYRGYKNQFVERMWGKGCRIYIYILFFLRGVILHIILTYENCDYFLIWDWYTVVHFLNWNIGLR